MDLAEATRHGSHATLWHRLTGRAPAEATAAAVTLPAGDGPLVWMRLGADFPLGDGLADQLTAALQATRPGLRLVVTHPAATPLVETAAHKSTPVRDTSAPATPWPDPGANAEAIRPFLAHLSPAVLLLVGSELPETLMIEADRLDVPVVLAHARLSLRRPARAQPWGRDRLRSVMPRLPCVLAPDSADRDAAIRMGVMPERIKVTGHLTETRRPPGCAEAERVALAAALRGRQSWFAVAVPEAEEDAVIAAHRVALGHSHRALLILAPVDSTRGQVLVDKLEAEGLAAAVRSQIDEPSGDLQVLVADDPGEFGLWYRLAPVTYMGGTLSGDDAGARHPFEAAALGSAILHGPCVSASPEAWRDLRAAYAACEVASPDKLGPALDDMLSPDRMADFAARAWAVSTAGAGVAQRIAGAVVDHLG